MRKIIVLLIIFVAIANIVIAQTFKYTTADLYLRQAPSKNSRIITTIPKGTCLVFPNYSNQEWQFVTFNSYYKGYVSSRYLSSMDIDDLFYDEKTGHFYDKNDGARIVSQQEYDQQQRLRRQFANFVNSATADELSDLFSSLSNQGAKESNLYNTGRVQYGAGNLSDEEALKYGESKYDEHYGLSQMTRGSAYENLEEARSHRPSLPQNEIILFLVSFFAVGAVIYFVCKKKDDKK